jgi:hypothetical protein
MSSLSYDPAHIQCDRCKGMFAEEDVEYCNTGKCSNRPFCKDCIGPHTEETHSG